MTSPMYTFAVPVFKQMLMALKAVLAQASAHATAHSIEPDALLQARLYPDMFALAKQVQIAADFARGVSARLAGVEIPKFEDTETTFPELKARIAKTIAFLKTLDRKAFTGAENKEIVLKFPNVTLEYNGRDYVGNFVMPNTFFHITTAYGILRNRGVALGKGDYLGGAQA